MLHGVPIYTVERRFVYDCSVRSLEFMTTSLVVLSGYSLSNSREEQTFIVINRHS